MSLHLQRLQIHSPLADGRSRSWYSGWAKNKYYPKKVWEADRLCFKKSRKCEVGGALSPISEIEAWCTNRCISGLSSKLCTDWTQNDWDMTISRKSKMAAKIQDGRQNFKIDNIGASGIPSLSLKFGINLTQNDWDMAIWRKSKMTENPKWPQKFSNE